MQNDRREEKMMPRVSIVIPAFNAARTIASAIEGCLAQDYPSDKLEVIIVDDGSRDGTQEIARAYPVIYLRQENAGPARARNLGWQKAQGQIVCFTDADCIPEKGWVTALVRHYTSDGIGAVGGSYGIANVRNILADCIHQEILYRHARMPVRVRALGSYNLSVRKDILRQVGGFDESYRMASGEDNDLSYKIHQAGYSLVFDKDVRVRHYHPEDLLKYLRSQFWHGFWRVKLYKDHPGMAKGDDYSSPWDYAQPWIALLTLFLLVFRFLPWVGTAVWFLLAVNVVLQLPLSFSLVAKTGNPRYFRLVPLMFLRSFARGLGMCWGTCVFLLFKKNTLAFVLGSAIATAAHAQSDAKRSFDPTNMDDIKVAVETLKKANDSDPGNQRIRQELAKAYNFYAIQLASRVGTDLAIDYLQKAHYLCPECDEYSQNLSMLYTRRGHDYYVAKDIPRARNDLKTAVTVFPRNVAALIGLGNIYYSDQNLEEASRCWAQALALEPGNQEISVKLSLLQKEREQSKLFKSRETQNFVFMFEQALDEYQFGNIENILNEAYVKVGQDFNYFPTYKITVQIFSSGKYRTEIQPVENIVGVYDGKIKLPAYSAQDVQQYRRTVYHEYVHALVYDLSGDRCPRWLHEGLATYEDPGFSADAALIYGLYRTGGLVRPGNLDGYFLDLRNDANLRLAYSESYALIKYCLQRFNFWHIKNVLTYLKNGAGVDEAFRRTIYMDTDQLFENWENDVLKNKLPI
ncbi:MAG TPA: glycosyltransferase [Patescibacteria group bacterium]|nr:glycosyltransferase [Patescibacteria group bacterium]